MSKELIPLEALERIKNTQVKNATSPFDYVYIKDERKHELDIIETELKRLEEIDSRSSMRLENIVPHLYDDNEELKKARDMWKGIADNLREKLNKQDEILRIIKEKQVQINRLNRSYSAKQYNLYLPKEMHLTQAEFDLLKEILK